MIKHARATYTVVGGIRDMAGAGLHPDTLFAQLGDMLCGAVGADASCWHTADPVTGFPTSTRSYGLDLRSLPTAIRIELRADELLTSARVRAGGRTVDTLHRATHGRPERSHRYRRLLTVHGFGDELRVNFDAFGGRWGTGVLLRGQDRPPFTGGEVRLVERCAREIASALRTSYRPDGGTDPSQTPSLVILGPMNQPVSADRRGRELLAALRDPAERPVPIRNRPEGRRPGTGPDTAQVEPDGTVQVLTAPAPAATSLQMLAQLARAAPEQSANTRVLVPRLGWLMLYASLLDGRPDGRVSVVASAASPGQLTPLRLMLWGLTRREQEVVKEMLRGSSTRGIAETLSVAPGTVQDHLTAAFDKVGVRSRRELSALLTAPDAPPC